MAEKFQKFMKISGVVGPVKQRGLEDTIEVGTLSYKVSVQADPATGRVGRKQHAPIIVTKSIDMATPKLYDALCNDKLLNDVSISFYGPLPPEGRQGLYFTIQLENAKIISIIQGSGQNNLEPQEREQVTFICKKISWTWEDGDITAEDNWLSTV